MYRKLDEAKKSNNHSPKDIVEISESISSINISGQRHAAKTIKRAKGLLKKLKAGYLTEQSWDSK